MSAIMEREEEEKNLKNETIETHIKQFPPISATSSQRFPSQTRPSSVWAAVVSSEPKAAATESEPKAADSQPKAAATESEPKASDSQPKAADIQPKAADIQPKAVVDYKPFKTASTVSSWSDFMDEEEIDEAY